MGTAPEGSSTPLVLFPGQGAQFVGMAGEWVETSPTAAALFARGSAILGYDLLQICTEGPEDKLNTTAISQPAIYVASLAAIEAIKADKGQDYLDSIDVCCGLSLGEYTSLTFAGAMSFEDGVCALSRPVGRLCRPPPT